MPWLTTTLLRPDLGCTVGQGITGSIVGGAAAMLKFQY